MKRIISQLLVIWLVIYGVNATVVHAVETAEKMNKSIAVKVSRTGSKDAFLETGIAAHKLPLVYSVDNAICKQAAELIEKNQACRPFDARDPNCGRNTGNSDVPYFWSSIKLQEIATNEYGYTEVYRTDGVTINGYAVIYLQAFVTDRVPRLVQMWKVDAEALERVLKIPPGPLSAEQRNDLAQRRYPRETNSEEFSRLLADGEKLSDEWSPIIAVADNFFIVKRECAGTWAFGGYYVCNKELKLDVLRVSPNRRATTYCQFAKTRNK